MTLIYRIYAYVVADLTYRGNALLFCGPPISHLPTARLFAYATHFDAHPLGLEWVDDNTCVFVFDSKTAARTAYRYLQKSATEDSDQDGCITAKGIPIAVWPPEERINKSLGMGQGLKGTIRMRWAKNDDVKKKGAKRDSEFYKKHGTTAGKEVYAGRDEGPQKRRRRDDEVEQAQEKAQLDDDLDDFLAEDDLEPVAPPSPPSKMRSDYIASDGRTLLERTSVLRAHPDILASRITAPLPRRAKGRNDRRGSSERESLSQPMWADDRVEWGREAPPRGRSTRDKGPGRSSGHARPRKSQQELDDELDAFLNEKD